jgi:hypothetical protein
MHVGKITAQMESDLNIGNRAGRRPSSSSASSRDALRRNRRTRGTGRHHFPPPGAQPAKISPRKEAPGGSSSSTRAEDDPEGFRRRLPSRVPNGGYLCAPLFEASSRGKCCVRRRNPTRNGWPRS